MQDVTSRTRQKRAVSARRMRLRRLGLHQEAAERLRRLIVRGDLMPGDTVNEAALSEDLGVSRTPLREAIKLLAAEGLLELRRNRSPVVATLHADEVEVLFEAVGAVERAAAELAAQRATPRDLRRLSELQERMERYHHSGNLREYFDTNQQVHAFIVECARNSVLRATHAQLLARAERARFFALFSQSRWEEAVAEHQQILRALQDRDASRAGELLGHHVRRTGEVCAQSVSSRPPAERAGGTTEVA